MQIFRTFGTKNITDLLEVCFDYDYIKEIKDNEKFTLIKKFVHPISFKYLDWKNSHSSNIKKMAKNRIIEDFHIAEISDPLDCYDLARKGRKFQERVYGIKIAFPNKKEKKTLIVYAIVDDIVLQCTNYSFINKKIKLLYIYKPSESQFEQEIFEKFIQILTIKELLIYNKEEIYQRFMGYITQVQLIKQKSISQVIKEFITADLYSQRTTLIQLLIHNNNPEFQYLAYLLYDLLSNDSNGTIDTVEQTILYDCLPWQIKKYFREAMITTNNYTKNLSDFNSSKIPVEQRICLLKANDTIKEKAMIKLKEVKAKSEDTGTKARQYLDGLLKIPFGIYRQEPVLMIMKELRLSFCVLLDLLKKDKYNIDIQKNLSAIQMNLGAEIMQYTAVLENKYLIKKQQKNIEKLNILYTQGKRNILIANVCYINSLIKKHNIEKSHICHSGKKNMYMKDAMMIFIKKNKLNHKLIIDLKKKFEKQFNVKIENKIIKEINNIKKKMVKY